jgi:hypothetical protein
MAIGAVALAFALGAWCGSAADAVVVASPPRASGAVPSAGAGAGPGAEGGSLETAAAKAGNTGRTVAMSLIGLALAVSATVLAFKRDFKEAAGVFAVGVVAVLLATPAGVALLRDTVSSLFGGP